MAIVYKEELEMLKKENVVTDNVQFEPEIFIYIQKLMKEQNKTFAEVVNNIIRKHAENSIIPKYVPPISQHITMPLDWRFVETNPDVVKDTTTYEPHKSGWYTITNPDGINDTTTYLTFDTKLNRI